jgi:hypothetical protein
MRFGPAVLSVGGFAFEIGIVVGHVFRERRDLLLKVVRTDLRESFDEFCKDGKERATSIPEADWNLQNLWIRPQLSDVNVSWPPPKKALSWKIKEGIGVFLLNTAYYEGIGFTLVDKHNAEVYFANQYRAVPDHEWQQARAHGLQISEQQESRTLDDAIVDFLGVLLDWTDRDPDASQLSQSDREFIDGEIRLRTS